MEKNIINTNLDIVIKTQENGVVFEIKEPKKFHRAVMNDIKQDLSLVKRNTIVIYPEQKIIDSQRVFIETNSQLL